LREWISTPGSRLRAVHAPVLWVQVIEKLEMGWQNREMGKVVAPEMSLHALGVRVGLLMFATVFFSFAVGEGSGSFWAGASHAFLGLLLYGFGYAVISTLAALAAVGLGRLVGTKVAFALSLNAMVVLSFWAWLSA
jgi:hypothetical protein